MNIKKEYYYRLPVSLALMHYYYSLRSGVKGEKKGVKKNDFIRRCKVQQV
jgi:hypothetical protein